MGTRVSGKFHALFCAAVLVCCTLLARPYAELGFNDDWQYIWSANVLAHTGHIVYTGFVQPILGWQLFWGALFIKLFGFSFTAPRFGGLLIAVATAFLLQRAMARAGLSEGNATLATLSLLATPLYLPLAFSFMSDLGGLFSIVLCLYACLRALDAPSGRGALTWLLFAAVSSTLTGTVRQAAWMGVLVMVPSTAWLLRNRVSLLTVALTYIACACAIFGCMHWFAAQPYTMRDQLFGFYPDRVALANIIISYTRASLGMSFFLLPLLLAFLRKPALGRRGQATLLVASVLGSVVLALLLARTSTQTAQTWLAPFTDNYVTTRGLVITDGVIGNRPLVVPLAVTLLVTVLCWVSLAYFIAWCTLELRSRNAPFAHPAPGPSFFALLVLLVPFFLGNAFLLITRAAQGDIWDRYLLPLLVAAAILIVRLFQERVSVQLPLLSTVAVALFALFGVAGLHDVYARQRARLAAAEELRAHNVPDTAFYAGFEYDGWTQLRTVGYVNSSQIAHPANAWHDPGPYLAHHPCGYGYTNLFIAIKARYILSYDPAGCDGATSFAPVVFGTWLPPFHQTLYINRIINPALAESSSE